MVFWRMDSEGPVRAYLLSLFTVLRFRHDEEWEPLLMKYPSVFGTGS